MKTWSKELVDLTRREIEDMLTYTDEGGNLRWLIGCMDLEAAHFKNIDGRRYGLMTAEDARNDRFIVRLKEGSGEENFATVDALIEAGWALD
jgi:hypothetical protein